LKWKHHIRIILPDIMTDFIHFICAKEGNRLRVHITSPGYDRFANVQFPRDIRAPGRKFKAPVSGLKFSQNSSRKFFFKYTNRNLIEITDEDPSSTLIVPESTNVVARVFETEDTSECVVCYDKDYDVVLAPCGHLCLCGWCAQKIYNSTRECPMCRSHIDNIVPRDQIQY